MFDELRVIQQEFGYLPAEQLQRLAGKINVPLSQIHAVASFYPHFQLTPPPRADVRVCADMSCHLRGGGEVKTSLEQAFRGSSAEAVAIRDVSCLGRCDQAPRPELGAPAAHADPGLEGGIGEDPDAMEVGEHRRVAEPGEGGAVIGPTLWIRPERRGRDGAA